MHHIDELPKQWRNIIFVHVLNSVIIVVVIFISSENTSSYNWYPFAVLSIRISNMKVFRNSGSSSYRSVSWAC